MKNFNELLVTDRANLTVDESNFLKLHDQIMFSGTSATVYIVEFSKKLKEMRDGKLYESAGFESFGEYVEQAVNLKQRQAYKYIELYENFSEEFLVKNGTLGITKLLLLTDLSEEEREEVAKDIVENDLSVEELKKLLEEREQESQSLKDEKEKIDKKLKAEEKAREKLQRQLTAVEQEKSNISRMYDELLSKPKKEFIDNPETLEKVKQLSEEMDKKDLEILSLRKKLGMVNNVVMVKFSVKFEELQHSMNSIDGLLAEMDDDSKQKCIGALKSVWRY